MPNTIFNILITGSNGQLGSEIRELEKKYSYNFFFTDRTNINITSNDSIKNICASNKIDTIINCAAYTAVDKAETDTENADLINRKAVEKLAIVSKELDIRFIHISTDYVFDGENYKPYIESDITNPQGVYGETKLAGDNAMLKVNPRNSIIIRTSWVYSSFGSNFVKTMLRLGRERDTLDVIFDQVGTPTYARDLALAILDILPKINNEEVEVYHYSNEGVASWYDFSKEIMDMTQINCVVNPIETSAYPTPAKRPHYSLLNKKKIKNSYGINIPNWRDSLKDCLKKLQKGL
ncbi:dTDP-4-dehydrorhamnose reductase [Francisella adeliensis]|uniref:dTDP-4-dehydrorhamnose reductase n=1 Tax=Francisella adeliensis TaxID=2007306 RepID=A0A2Z4XXB4_9GAMM|nr:dTDP-4-dehydrorhamnose reductase [Francisella adeliensis]AXA33389.1 dTDP-4-dehydrorhamnose reductase [Francisella adeliensis]MBK2085405.1 dTDP-4-dehydrorhamnose reductase [Francisella adeliensis]MBK2097135.1 dTDP-4-dehydrorhamnose reductase [Francisella adeliensis]QIW11617.1 dTDP-4-dehydrorhamnose reductase [Francisella adeliensis]QIW13492.1 dTDP-4-dehydrorhamnose reductase [Francisella adeliensis]